MRMVTIIAILFYSVNIHAAGMWHFGLNVKDVTAQNKANQTAFRVMEEINNPAGCPNTDYYGIRSDAGPQFAMSILLTAYTSGKKVDVYVVDNQCDAFGRPSVTDVRIRN